MIQLPKLVPIHTGHSWNNLVISHDTHARVDEIIKWIAKQADTKRRNEKGGLNVLFDGPSSTLKDITAILIAKEAGWLVYRIDLSSIISKYIGETEKNLAAVFDKVHNKDSILFFDEADALFGKRTDIKDSHDRYAAAEIFLNKLDEFDGLAIIGANLKNNIDEAFTRRFHMVVNIGTGQNREM